MRVALSTLGCKINQFESEALRSDLASRGATIVPFAADADVYVVNTCSVTARSDAQCRQVIRAAARRGARVVVTGCYATTRPEDVRRIEGVDLVVPNDGKGRLPEAVLRLGAASAAPSGEPSPDDTLPPVPSRTRGFLKIQDGCDGICSYCIVPNARGRSRSVAAADVTASFDHLIAGGVPEVVLSGVHIGRYGADFGSGPSLTTLLSDLVTRRGASRIRLSSIEPREVTDELIGLLGNGLCRHLHIPLQSGDDGILAAMRRDYDSRRYLDVVERIAAAVPGVALGADVMVGFPGEGEREFLNTFRLIEQSPLTHFHVFSFSARPGTDAAGLNGQIPEAAKKERSEALRELGKKKNLLFRRGLVGSVLSAVVEEKKDPVTGCFMALTDNYVRTGVPGAGRDSVGKLFDVRIISADDEKTRAACA